MTTAHDIFISYAREDRSAAERFAAGFSAAGLSVWWDSALQAGESFDLRIEEAIKSAKAAVVLWSEHSVKSRWVRAEATLADRLRKLLPVRISPCDLPIMFELTHTAELSAWDGSSTDESWAAFLGEARRFIEKHSVSPPPAALGPIPVTVKPPSPTPTAQTRLAERRQVTVLNSAVTDTVEDAFDPEDWREIVVAFQREAARIV